jgi:hypothetical protein
MPSWNALADRMLFLESRPLALAATDWAATTTTMRLNRNCMHFPFRDAEEYLGGPAEWFRDGPV